MAMQSEPPAQIIVLQLTERAQSAFSVRQTRSETTREYATRGLSGLAKFEKRYF